jgi:Fur family ferric uptake transcriptional regulator
MKRIIAYLTGLAKSIYSPFSQELSVNDQELRDVGLKVTTARLKILKILENANPHHMSAEDLYKRLLSLGEDIGLATIYRVLTQFEEAELVRRHYFEGGHSVYELNEGEHHDHLVCVKCSRVEEFVDPLIETRQVDIAKAHHFELTDHHHTIYGLCPSCQ